MAGIKGEAAVHKLPPLEKGLSRYKGDDAVGLSSSTVHCGFLSSSALAATSSFPELRALLKYYELKPWSTS